MTARDAWRVGLREWVAGREEGERVLASLLTLFKFKFTYELRADGEGGSGGASSSLVHY